MMSRRRREKRREMVGVRRAYQRAVQGAVSQRSTREGYGARWENRPIGRPKTKGGGKNKEIQKTIIVECLC
jgi:hypothetical protein